MKKIFLLGLKTIVPIALTIALVAWLFETLEGFFGYFVERLTGPSLYFPGLGLIIGIVFIFFVGILMNAWVAQQLYALGERILKKIPVIKSLYSAFTDLMGFFDANKRPKGSAVMVDMPQLGVRVIGFITRENFDDLPEGMQNEDEVLVYIPLSYQIGGFTTLLPRSRLTPLDMPVDRVMSFCLTAGVTGKNN